MPPKKGGKRGRFDEQPNAEPKAKRRRENPQHPIAPQKSDITAINTTSNAGNQHLLHQCQQQQKTESPIDYGVDDTYHEYGDEQQAIDNLNQGGTTEGEISRGETSEPLPFEINVIQAEEWDVLTPNNRLYSLNWSLIKAIRVLEYIHIGLMEAQNSDSERYESSDRSSPAPSGGVLDF